MSNCGARAGHSCTAPGRSLRPVLLIGVPNADSTAFKLWLTSIKVLLGRKTGGAHESKPARARPTRRALFPAPHRQSASHGSSGTDTTGSGSCIQCLASSFRMCVYASTRRSTRRCGSARAVAHPRQGPSGMPAPSTPHRRSGGHTKQRAVHRNAPLQTSATRGEGRLHPVGAPRVGPKDATPQNKVVADNNRDALAAAAAAV